MPFLAIGAVDIILLVVALAAILVLGAMWVFSKPIQGVLSDTPLVGGWLSDAFDRLLGAAVQTVSSWFDSLAVGVAHLFWAFGVGVWHLVNQIVNTFAHLSGQILTLTTRVGELYVAAVQIAQAFYQLALDALNAAVTWLVAYVDGRIAWLLGVVQYWIDFVEQYARSLYGDALAAIATVEASILATVARDVSAAEALAGALADKVANEAVRLFAEAEAEAQALFGTAEAGIAGLAGQITGIEGEIAPLIGALPLIGAIPLLQSAVTALTAEADQCLKPLCDTVTPRAPQLGNLGKFLQDLEVLGVDVLVGALFVEAVTDPAQVVSDAISLTETLGDPIVTGVRDLVGL